MRRIAPTREGRIGEVHFGLPDLDQRLRGVELGLGSGELGVKVRRLDLGKDLPLRDLSAEVEVPSLEIAVHPRVDGRRVPRLDIAGQNKFLARHVLRGMQGGRRSESRLPASISRPPSRLRYGSECRPPRRQAQRRGAPTPKKRSVLRGPGFAETSSER